MAEFTLAIGNRNYSSWSLRGWLIVRASGVVFEEEMVRLKMPDTAAAIARHSPAGLLPVLAHNGLAVWDTLAIAEYLHELRPDAGLWPKAAAARAVARAVSAEMHAGFPDVRREMPMNVRGSFSGRGQTSEIRIQIQRMVGLWMDCRKRFAGSATRDDGFLFGTFTVADAMYAPMVTRLRTYGVALDPAAKAYCDAVFAWPAMVQWCDAAAHEPWLIEEYEFG